MKHQIFNSINTKTILFISMALILTVLITVGFTMQKMTQYAETVAQEDAIRGMNGFNAKLEDLKAEALVVAGLLAENNDLARAVETKDISRLRKVLHSIFQDIKLEFLTVTDSNGIVLFRTPESDNSSANVMNHYNIQMALKNQPVAVIEKNTAGELSVIAGVPVKTEQGTVVGVISTGFQLDNPVLLDDIKKVFQTDLSLFQGDVRYNTTVIQDGKRVIGNQLDPQIASKVLNYKERFTGNSKVLGVPFITSAPAWSKR